MNYFIIHSDKDKAPFVKKFLQLSIKKALRIEIEPHFELRTNSANNLYWKWLTVIAKNLSEGGWGKYSKDDMHDYCRDRFLPKQPAKQIGSRVIGEKLASTRKMKINKFGNYMQKIEVWATSSLGMLLPCPCDNEYSLWLESQNQ
jgi:hypothetical protein